MTSTGLPGTSRGSRKLRLTAATSATRYQPDLRAMYRPSVTVRSAADLLQLEDPFVAGAAEHRRGVVVVLGGPVRPVARVELEELVGAVHQREGGDLGAVDVVQRRERLELRRVVRGGGRRLEQVVDLPVLPSAVVAVGGLAELRHLDVAHHVAEALPRGGGSGAGDVPAGHVEIAVLDGGLGLRLLGEVRAGVHSDGLEVLGDDLEGSVTVGPALRGDELPGDELLAVLGVEDIGALGIASLLANSLVLRSSLCPDV